MRILSHAPGTGSTLETRAVSVQWWISVQSGGEGLFHDLPRMVPVDLPGCAWHVSATSAKACGLKILGAELRAAIQLSNYR